MGYTTDFKGKFVFDKPLSSDHAAYLKAFNETRRMKRDETIVATFKDELRESVGLPIGKDGAYYVGSHTAGNHGQTHDNSIIDYNNAPGTVERLADYDAYYKENNQRIADGLAQPGLWCQWTVGSDNQSIEWDGGEKFYNYIEWLKYIIENFTAKWGYVLNGRITWRGEDHDDIGVLLVDNNEVSTQ